LKNRLLLATSLLVQGAAIIDVMGIVQKIHGENHTSRELSGQILKSVLNQSCKYQRVGIVFDVYNERSLKNAEREV
jgi:hypothetical protein